MVNASLNWASIVGIVLAVCGGGLYFLRSFKPALARDYDVFFAAIGLLCGGILFFQGWRLDPILQFGQFLLAGTTVFFAYESVRLRGIATDQARRSSFFDDDEIPNMPRNRSRSGWDEDYEQFVGNERPSRRFKSRDEDAAGLYQEERSLRRSSRAIPESAVSRRRSSVTGVNQYDEIRSNRASRFNEDTNSKFDRNNFGQRRTIRNEVKRGSRPIANQNTTRLQENSIKANSSNSEQTSNKRNNLRSQSRKAKVEDASFTQTDSDFKKSRQLRRSSSSSKPSSKSRSSRYNVASKKDKPRDNNSRFDD